VTPSAFDLSRSTRMQRADAVLWREGEFGVVVLAPGATEPQTLTGTGRALWHALDQPISPTDLAGALAVRFGADPGNVWADVVPVLTELARIGAIDVEPE
jgi:Coenzyme PQQ synthesis protein D (PqqD)